MWLTSGAPRRLGTRNTDHDLQADDTANLKSARSTSENPASPSSILVETLRRNPFKTKKEDVISGKDARTKALNKDLHVLAAFFPDVQIEVLRELLGRFEGDSRLHICTEQLYKYKGEWAAGRIQNPPRELNEPIPRDQQFRRHGYTNATARLLTLEFRTTVRSSMFAVLAEVNWSYSKARPILLDIANKSKWALFSHAIGWKRKRSIEDAPAALFDGRPVNGALPRLIRTGDQELDQEIDALFLEPLRVQRSTAVEQTDHELAEKLNEAEALENRALFECEVCYDEVPFERVTTCTTAEHHVCLDCVRRTLHEAIYGQGWHRSVSHEHGTLKCLSASSECEGRIPMFLVQRAILSQSSGPQTWATFDSRLFEANIQKSNMGLVRCPFCPYAEAEMPLDPAAARTLRWSVRRPAVPTIVLILMLELLPTLLFMLGPLLLFFPAYMKHLFYTAIASIALRNRRTRFTCHNPTCSRSSCLICLKPWHDPHICHEPLIVSLRTSVEAARTAAVKRVCPRCGMAFVKSSGCNKLTCPCGYSMCYLCRANIGKAGAEGNAEGAEGYRHFCEHFRPTAGKKCTQCDKCDLYREENEDEMARRAGEQAEQDWREREGMVGVKGLESAVGNLGGPETAWDRFRSGHWTVQGVVTGAVALCVVVEEV
jgi:hypothetical protein